MSLRFASTNLYFTLVRRSSKLFQFISEEDQGESMEKVQPLQRRSHNEKNGKRSLRVRAVVSENTFGCHLNPPTQRFPHFAWVCFVYENKILLRNFTLLGSMQNVFSLIIKYFQGHFLLTVPTSKVLSRFFPIIKTSHICFAIQEVSSSTHIFFLFFEQISSNIKYDTSKSRYIIWLFPFLFR